MIIGISSLLVVCYAVTIPQKDLPNSPMSKYKTKVMPIVYITKLINTPKCNIIQARHIKDSLSNFEDKVRCQGPKGIILDLLLELSYPLINEFWDVFKDEASTKRLNTCKNMDQYENIVRSFHARLVLFVQGLYYDKCETVFCSTTPAFYHSMDKNKKIALLFLFKNAYNWIEMQLITHINSYI